MRFGSLFAGIGGIDLGLERAGMRCAWQVEIDPFCRSVLARHWPDVPRHEDVRAVDFATLPQVDVLAGGFPCQDISNVGKREGIGGERSGLWSEFARAIRELRPGHVLVENTAGLSSRGMGRVLGDLANLGYDAEWEVLPAAAFGARHIRDRVFVVAYPARQRLQGRDGPAPEGWGRSVLRVAPPAARPVRWDVSTPAVCRGADGVPFRVERTRALGNAVVPQVAEWIGRRIMEAADNTTERRAA
jgi:DNA (cytosine-5)-methyltransferase 1